MQHGDLISLLSSFRSNEGRLKYNYSSFEDITFRLNVLQIFQ
jgi:hypothetical protein